MGYAELTSVEQDQPVIACGGRPERTLVSNGDGVDRLRKSNKSTKSSTKKSCYTLE